MPLNSSFHVLFFEAARNLDLSDLEEQVSLVENDLNFRVRIYSESVKSEATLVEVSADLESSTEFSMWIRSQQFAFHIRRANA